MCRVGGIVFLLWIVFALEMPVLAEPNGESIALGADSSAWWMMLEDAHLKSCIESGLKGAPDIHIASARARQAQAISAQQASLLSPALTASWSSNTQPRDALGFGFGLSSQPSIPGVEPVEEDESTERFTTATASLGLNVPIDLWGRAWTAYRGAQADARASRHEQKATELALGVSIANAYYDWALTLETTHISAQQLAIAEDLLSITKLQQERGEASALDILQQAQQVASTRGQLPRAELSQRTAEQRLLVLMGRSPSESLSIRPDFSSPSVDSKTESSDVILQRPDIAAAADRVVAAEKRKSSSGRDFLPSLSVGGALQRQLNYSSDTEEWDDIDTWNVTTGVQLTLFQGGQKLQAYRQAQAVTVQAEQSLRQAELRAQQELESALQGVAIQKLLRAAAVEQLSAAERSFTEARHQYEQGVITVLTVLSTQTAFYQAQLLELQSRRDTYNAHLQLVSATGGQWDPQLNPAKGEP